MKPPLKLSAIEQEHLQDLYDAAGIARDELPYTPVFDQFVQDFQDRTFKNADPEQVYGALLKYARTGANSASDVPIELPCTPEQLKTLRGMLSRHAAGGKVLPYSDAINIAHAEFKRATNIELSDLQFWQAVVKTAGAKRRPPPRKKAVKVEEDDGE